MRFNKCFRKTSPFPVAPFYGVASPSVRAPLVHLIRP